MKIIVLSDSHNSFHFAPFLEIAQKADTVIHCGDGSRDKADLESVLTVPFYSVKGNCDFTGIDELLFEIENKKFFATHGHFYGVKTDLTYLRHKVEEVNADVILYGHTHIPSIDFFEGRIFINPGSLTRPVGDYKSTYCEIEILDGKVIPTLKEYKR